MPPPTSPASPPRRGEIDDVARAYWDAGIRHIVALRGDPPGGMGGKYCPHPGGYANAAELVAGLKKIGDFQISVAGYPEKHPDSADATGRSRQPQAQGRCRRRPLHHPVLLRGRRLPALPRCRRGRPASTCRSCRASCRCRTSRASPEMAGLCGSKVPAWLAEHVRRPRRRRRDPPHDRRHRGRRPLPPPAGRRRRPVPFLHAEPRRPHLRDLPPAGSPPP